MHSCTCHRCRCCKLCTHASTDSRVSACMCFCCSGHNSYLQGNQLTSTAGTQTIEIGLRHSCRVVELDVYDGPTEPVSRCYWLMQLHIINCYTRRSGCNPAQHISAGLPNLACRCWHAHILQLGYQSVSLQATRALSCIPCTSNVTNAGQVSYS